jgi:hypothetical protein
MTFHTKQDIARRYAVTPRSVDNWRARGLLPEPLKLGTATQSRVRWSDADLEALDRNLGASARARQTAEQAA